MKKLLIVLLLLNQVSVAQVSEQSLEKYLDNRDIVLQILGVADHYIERCGGLTEVGEMYYRRSLEKHKLTRVSLAEERLYQAGYKMVSQYPTCHTLVRDFKSLGIVHLFKVQA